MLSRPKTELELFFNSLQFGDIRKPHRLEDDIAELAAITKLLGENKIFLSAE